MTVYVVVETWENGVTQILGVYSSYEKAEKAKMDDFSVWRNGTREIFKRTLDK
jgi:hypothetical protein